MPPTFADLGVPKPLCSILAGRGVAEPFPIQAATLPDALAGRDVCGRAPTGSGKTLAFGLTIAHRVRPAKARRPTVLVLVPTRELAAQVAKEIEALSGHHGQKVATLYGGTSYGPQRQALRKGASIVVACPGRLEDLVDQGDIQLGDVDLVVLDEADRMAEMGFLPAVRRLLDQTAADRQTLLFSATLDNDVDVLIRHYQDDPARHEVVADEDDDGDVSHQFWLVERSDRVQVTAGLVRRHGRAIVFCRTRHGVDRLIKQLGRVGVEARGVHGSRTQSQREKALAAFTAGRVDALVATDVAARGIHVDDVACVVHFDIPADPKDYIHRSGRTGRAGADGAVVSLVMSEQRKDARVLQRSVGVAQDLDRHDLAPDLLKVEPLKPADDGRRTGAASGGGQDGRNRQTRGQGQGQGRGSRTSRRGGSANGDRRGQRPSGEGRGSDERGEGMRQRSRRRSRNRSGGNRPAKPRAGRS